MIAKQIKEFIYKTRYILTLAFCILLTIVFSKVVPNCMDESG